MSIVVTCECGKRLRVKEELAGQKGKCPACGKILLIPDTESPTSPEDAFQDFLFATHSETPTSIKPTYRQPARTSPPYTAMVLGTLVVAGIFAVYRFDPFGILHDGKPEPKVQPVTIITDANDKSTELPDLPDKEDLTASLTDPNDLKPADPPDEPAPEMNDKTAPEKSPEEPVVVELSPSEQGDKLLVQLFEKKQLANKRDYKKVRSAFSKRFELANGHFIQAAYGDDHDSFTAWLEKHSDLKEDFHTAIDEDHDDVSSTLRIFKDIWKAHPDKFADYGHLAIATAVT